MRDDASISFHVCGKVSAIIFTQPLASSALNTPVQDMPRKIMEKLLPISEMPEHPATLSLSDKAKEFLTRHIALVVLALFITVGFWVVDDYGIGTDTGAQRTIAESVVAYAMGRDDVWLNDYDSFYGASYELSLLLLERALGLEDTRVLHLMRHLVTHLFFLTGGFFCYLLAYRLFRSRLLALFAMLLFLLHPRIYAHSFFNSKDAPFLSMFMICLYLTHFAFRNGNVWRFLILGIAAGILMNLRIMGLALFFSVVAMCVLDLFQASSAGERKRALGSIGVFVLSCMAALYAVSPYLWSDPAGSFAEWFAVLSQHPVTVYQLFRGDVIVSTSVNPPEYVPVWMSITTPPVVVVLGIAGTCMVLLRGLFRPRDVLANTRMRFWFVLVGCFITPIVASIVLSSNVYNGWRQMYFLYAPFCLLAVFGVHWLTSAMLHRRLKKLSALAVGSGIVLSVVAMASIHPHEYIYFNFLVDRTTPEHLRSQYDMDYWGISFREGMEHLLERPPYPHLHVQSPRPRITRLTRELFHSSDRHRIFVFDRDADFLITTYDNFKGNKIYGLKIYNNTIHSIADVSSTGNRVVDVYRRNYLDAALSEPVIRSDFNVYLDDRVLTYAKETCSVRDTEVPFFLHVFPSDVEGLSKEHRESAFKSIRFEFYRRGAKIDNACVVKIALPDYEIERIRTGQYERDEEDVVWMADYNVSAGAELPDVVERLRGHGIEPVIRSDFDVYLDAGRLIYFKSPCTVADAEAPLFVHLHPLDIDDLSPDSRQSRFDSFSFGLLEQGVISDEECFTSFDLPQYAVRSFLTGQLSEDGDKVWERVYSFAASELPGIVEELRGRGAEPVISSYFDVYRDQGQLIYVKDSCKDSDTDAEFFLHVVPSDVDALVVAAQSIGFENLDFAFGTHGLMFGGMCAAGVGLPDYEIAGIRTGQHDDENDMIIWYEEYSLAAADLPSVVENLRGRGVDPVVRSEFDVYLDGRRFTYFKSPCTVDDMEPHFFLHVYPVDVDDLPKDRRSSGFDSFSFSVRLHGMVHGEDCFTSFTLPDYDVAGFLTGQFTHGEGNLWEEGYSFAAAELPMLLESLRGRGGDPTIKSYFNVYRHESRLIYIRESCVDSDTDAKFFLHIYPVDADDIPTERRESGFDNLGFVFETHGLMFDGMCVASIGLPDYDIKRIRTGQWEPEQQRDIWKEEFDVGR